MDLTVATPDAHDPGIHGAFAEADASSTSPPIAGRIRRSSEDREAIPSGGTPSGPLARLSAGDQRAAPEVVDAYGPLVWSLAIRSMPDRAEAEDAVQEIFVNVWRHADRYDPERGEEATFVAMIARRRLIDRHRQIARRPADRAGGGERLDSVTADSARSAGGSGRGTGSGGASGIAGVEQAGDVTAVLRAMQELKSEQRDVLTLAIGSGRTYEQVAVALEMPLGTVKTHARRGLIRLREMLAGDAEDVS